MAETSLKRSRSVTLGGTGKPASSSLTPDFCRACCWRPRRQRKEATLGETVPQESS